MAPAIRALRQASEWEVKVCVNAQHRQMLDQVLSLFGIVPDFDLNLMKSGQVLTDSTANVMTGMRNVFSQWKPDLVFVSGDTTTAMAASLATLYATISVAHVEAGLRTNDIYSPRPEEIHRKIVGRTASLHFAPTETGRANLLAEGCADESIFVTGNTIIEALLNVSEKINGGPIMNQRLSERFAFIREDKRLTLVTGHRHENFGQGFEDICTALRKFAERDDVEIVYPVHLKPNVQEPVRGMVANGLHIHLIDQDFGGLLDVRRQQDINGQRLEQVREVTSRLRPRQGHLMHAMLRTRYERRSCMQIVEELATVEMAPNAFGEVIIDPKLARGAGKALPTRVPT